MIEIDDDYINLEGWEDLDDDNQPATTTATTVHGFELSAELGKNQYRDDGTIKTKHFVLETDNYSTQDTTATDDDKQFSNNLQSLLAMLNDPQTAAQVRTILDHQSSTTNSDTNPTNVTPMKPTPAASTAADAMDIDQE